jgi:hypothetical protein
MSQEDRDDRREAIFAWISLVLIGLLVGYDVWVSHG